MLRVSKVYEIYSLTWIPNQFYWYFEEAVVVANWLPRKKRYDQCVVHTWYTYGSQTWSLTKGIVKKLAKPKWSMKWQMLHISISNKKLTAGENSAYRRQKKMFHWSRKWWRLFFGLDIFISQKRKNLNKYILRISTTNWRQKLNKYGRIWRERKFCFNKITHFSCCHGQNSRIGVQISRPLTLFT